MALINLLNVGLWVALSILGLLTGAVQRRGKDYYPANLLVGLAVGTQGIFFLFFLGVFHGDLTALRMWAAATRAALWVYGGECALMVWALHLVYRVNHGRAGSSADLAGSLSPPTDEMVDEALEIIARADRHDLLNREQRRRLVEWRVLHHRDTKTEG